MSYIYKIKNHIMLEKSDIKELCTDYINKFNLQEWVETVDFIDKKDSVAGARINDKKICISNDINKYYKILEKECMGLMERILINSTSKEKADLYNLFVGYTIFHELWHFKQLKEMKENPDSTYSIFLNSSIILAKHSLDDYQMYHDKFYFEYDSDIHASILTLYIAELLNIEGKAVEIINRFFALKILGSYDKLYLETYDNQTDRYQLSPIRYFNTFLDDYFYQKYYKKFNSEEKDTMDKLVTQLSNLDIGNEDDINNLIIGNSVSDKIIEKLLEISDKNNKVDTTNIITELMECIKNNKSL